MRALFILLLIYFLTGTLQITGDRSFVNNDIGFEVTNDTIAFEYILSSDIGLSDSMIENTEDQEDETTALFLTNTISDNFENSIVWISSGNSLQLQKSLLLYCTNLPPPSFKI